MDIFTRKEAMRLGHTLYNTGKPCKYGHASQRYTLNGNCKVCARHKASLRNRNVRYEYHADVSSLSVRLHRDDINAVRQLAHTLNLARYGTIAPPTLKVTRRAVQIVYDGTAFSGRPHATDEDMRADIIKQHNETVLAPSQLIKPATKVPGQ